MIKVAASGKRVNHFMPNRTLQRYWFYHVEMAYVSLQGIVNSFTP